MSAQSSSPVSNITDQSPAAKIEVPPDADQIAANLEKQVQAQIQPSAASQDSSKSKPKPPAPGQSFSSQAGSQTQPSASGSQSQPNSQQVQTQQAQTQQPIQAQQTAASTQQPASQGQQPAAQGQPAASQDSSQFQSPPQVLKSGEKPGQTASGQAQTNQTASQPVGQSVQPPPKQSLQETIAEEIPSTESTTADQPAETQELTEEANQSTAGQPGQSGASGQAGQTQQTTAQPTDQTNQQTNQQASQAAAQQTGAQTQEQDLQEKEAQEQAAQEQKAPAADQPADQQQPEDKPADQKETSEQETSEQETSARETSEQETAPETNEEQKNDLAFQKSGSSSNFPGLLGVLEANNVIDANLAQEINNAHLNKGKSIEQLLKDSQAVSEVELIKAKAEFNSVPFIDVNDTGIAPEALNKVDESVAKRYQVLPFALDEQEKKLQVAMADPLNIPAISFIEQKTGYKLETHYGVPAEISRLISERYAQDLSGDVSAALEETSTMADRRQAVMDQNQRGGFIRAAPINKIVSTILNYAIQSRASDVHIEPLQEKTRVRYRIDGILHERLILPKSVHSAVVSRIKILSDLKIDEKRVPQDGRFDYQGEGGQEIDLRVSSCPGVHGEKIVMRLLKKNQAVPELEELGLSGLALQRVREAIRIPHGIFLVTGPTGSGKTTSLYSILHIINTAEVNIITLEDPVEYQMKGVTQVQVNPQAGLTFANGLRSFLRQDPDIIMVGEIRDVETAGLAVQASLTGHLVFSTLHTNSAAGALPRLMDMEVEPFLLSSSMILAMGQRVVRRINPDYKEEYKPEPAVIEDIKKVLGKHFDDWCQKNNKNPEDITLFRPKQDRPQNEPEFKGRIGIFEVMEITDTIQSLINKESSDSYISWGWLSAKRKTNPILIYFLQDHVIGSVTKQSFSLF